MNSRPDSPNSMDPLEHDLYRSVSARSSSIEPAAPSFETLGAPSQQHPRRVLLMAASVALPAPTDGSYPVPADGDVWACTGPVDASADGSADESTGEDSPTFWRTCTPVSGVDTIPTVATTIVMDVSADVDAPASTSTHLDPTTPTICTVPGRCNVDTVANGDNPTSVADTGTCPGADS